MLSEMNDTTERIEAGAAWLDRTDPTWIDRVDLDRLNLADSCGCVMGQIVSRYDASYFTVVAGENYPVPHLKAQAPRGTKRFVMSHAQAVARGFHISGTNENGMEWIRLTTAWRKAIRARRAARA